MCFYSLHVSNAINYSLKCIGVGGGEPLGERAMAEAVGWVGGTSQYAPFYTSRHLVEKGYCRYLVTVSANHEIKQIEVRLGQLDSITESTLCNPNPPIVYLSATFRLSVPTD